ncbi:MAG: DUF433 domain-containing protein [Acidobacteriota bacterium]
MNATQTQLSNPYVDFHHGGYWVAGTRVSLDSIVYRWREGLSPETIQGECFTTLTLSQVFGALAYYLDHQMQIDKYLEEEEANEDQVRAQIRATYPTAARRADELSKLLPMVRHENQVSSR